MRTQQVFTDGYIEHLKALEVAESIYNVAPNAVTKQRLEELKAKKFSVRERFASEYIKEYQNEKKEAKINAENEIKHTLNSLHIEEQYAEGKIMHDRRVELHTKNNLKYNQTYIL